MQRTKYNGSYWCIGEAIRFNAPQLLPTPRYATVEEILNNRKLWVLDYTIPNVFIFRVSQSGVFYRKYRLKDRLWIKVRSKIEFPQIDVPNWAYFEYYHSLPGKELKETQLKLF